MDDVIIFRNNYINYAKSTQLGRLIISLPRAPILPRYYV